MSNEMIVRGSAAMSTEQAEPVALAETAGAAAAAQAQAAVQARYLMAMKRPRDIDTVRVGLMRECKRPRFAEVARYSKPVGGKPIEGPSIRFVEAALRCLTNVLAETAVIYDDATKRIVRVTVTDLEANLTYPQDVAVDKTVERSNGNGRQILATRTNTKGYPVYVVVATEDELLNKQAALVSKAMRTCGLRLIPGDLVDEAMEQVLETQRNEDAQDPSAARKRIVDAFAAIGVLPAALAEYLGHEMATCSPADLIELRAIGTAIKNGETKWSEVMEARRSAEPGATTAPATTGPAALGLGHVQVPPLKTPKPAPADAARASLAKADTADKLDNLEIQIQNSPKLTAEEKGALTQEISAARDRLTAEVAQ